MGELLLTASKKNATISAMIKKILIIAILFIGLLYYLDRQGYIVITDKIKEKIDALTDSTQKKIDQKSTEVKEHLKQKTKDELKSALKKGNELVDEAWDEVNEERATSKK